MLARVDGSKRFSRKIAEVAIAKIAFFIAATHAPALSGAADLKCQRYEDSRRHSVLLHPKSFVDQAVCPGAGCADSPFTIPGLDNTPEAAIGKPGYKEALGRPNLPRQIYTLGCKRSATWTFLDNQIVDVEGPDIFVFEVGPSEEPTQVEISENGRDWINVGKIDGSNSSINIEKSVKPNKVYRFIRLTDLGTSCGTKTAGADIDAIATFGYSWTHVEDDTSTVFFDVGTWILKDKAKAVLQRQLAEFKSLSSYRLLVVGHTDSDGEIEDNQLLSVNRAKAVKDFLIGRSLIDPANIQEFGEGEEEPVAPNETVEGKRKNRRVELRYVPLSPCL